MATRHAAKSEAELEAESPEYEDGTSAAMLVSPIRGFLPHADADSQRVLFDALLMAIAMNGDFASDVASYGEPALGPTLAFLRSGALDRRDIAYDVLGHMLEAQRAG